MTPLLIILQMVISLIFTRLKENVENALVSRNHCDDVFLFTIEVLFKVLN